MIQMFGTAFSSAYGDSPTPIWLSAITGLSDAECAEGFQRLATEGREYPPNLTQFVAACRPPKGSPRFLGTPITPAQLRQLEAPSSQQPRADVLDDWLHVCRETIAKAEIKTNPKYPPGLRKNVPRETIDKIDQSES